MAPDCRESLAARQEGTNSVQGVPAAVPLSHQQSKGSALCVRVSVELCVRLFVMALFTCLLVCIYKWEDVNTSNVHIQTLEALLRPVDFHSD